MSTEKGVVTRWLDGKGFGFIEYGSRNTKVFVHAKEICDGRKYLNEGEKVTFSLAYDRKANKDMAVEVYGESDRRGRSSRSKSRGSRRSRSRSPPPRRRSRSRSPRGYRRRSPPMSGGRDYRSSIFCLDFKRGDCRYGDRCKFSHQKGEGVRHLRGDRRRSASPRRNSRASSPRRNSSPPRRKYSRSRSPRGSPKRGSPKRGSPKREARSFSR